MRNDIFSEHNHIGKTQRHLRDMAPAPSKQEEVEACLLDMWLSSFHNSRLMGDLDAAQNDNADDASNTATGMGAMYADSSVEGERLACVGGAISNPTVEAPPAAAVADVPVAVDMLEEPMAASDANFEVLMPNGRSLGVVVSTTAEQVVFFLSPPDSALGDRFKRDRSKMENRLAGRIGKQVKLTVL